MIGVKRTLERLENMAAAIESGFMPLMIPLDPPVEPLTTDEKTLLLDWLRDGAQPAFDVCE